MYGWLTPMTFKTYHPGRGSVSIFSRVTGRLMYRYEGVELNQRR